MKIFSLLIFYCLSIPCVTITTVLLDIYLPHLLLLLLKRKHDRGPKGICDLHPEWQLCPDNCDPVIL